MVIINIMAVSLHIFMHKWPISSWELFGLKSHWISCHNLSTFCLASVLAVIVQERSLTLLPKKESNFKEGIYNSLCAACLKEKKNFISYGENQYHWSLGKICRRVNLSTQNTTTILMFTSLVFLYIKIFSLKFF